MSDHDDPFKQFSRELAPEHRRSLADAVTERVRDSIVSGELGPGSRISEQALADSLAVSRGPVREALTELERIGLITIERHRGARVSQLTLEDVSEIYELRRALERLAMERAVRLAVPADFDEMESVIASLRAAVDAGDVHSVVRLDIVFHDHIYRAARHRRLYQCWLGLRTQIEFVLQSRARDRLGYLNIAVGEHEAMLAVIRSRSIPDALAMIDDHLMSAYDRLAQIIS